MTITRSTFSRQATRLLVILTFVIGLSGGVAVTGAAPAEAAVSARTATSALHYAASKRGALYKYGAVGPYRFDCSGLTKWAYAKVGKRIPRTAAQQYRATIRLSKARARKGDLVFFVSKGKIYHVGVYAGAGRIWHAPRTGSRVKLVKIWTNAVRYGRVR